MIHEISLEVGHQHFGPRFLDRVLCFCLGGGSLDPQTIASPDQRLVENETSKVSQLKWTACEESDHRGFGGPRQRALASLHDYECDDRQTEHEDQERATSSPGLPRS